LVIEYRFADGDLDRQNGLAAELVRLNVDVMLAGGGTPTARAAKNATIPSVMTNAADPVADGATYVDKILRFFGDCAPKKWPLRGS
jgi:putative ABC transport system substrate-binding protein